MNLFALQIGTPDVNLWLILPELSICIAGVVVMLVDAFAKPTQRWITGSISIVGLIAAAASSSWLYLSWLGPSEAFNGMIVLDELRLGFTFVFIVVSALTILVSMVWVENERLPAGEFHSLLMFATAGMMFMASAGDLVMVFLGLEILSIATYVMCGFRRTDVRSNESSMKYFILGSFSSAFLLYGIALTYGATSTVAGLPGTTNIAEIARRLPEAQYPLLLFAG
ncbi:MAG TPA: proton-conducting transporter membrane subunit, partial [Candidatus Sulfotelmatobacter sp.]|nr:proton-conducting transporter membrane subunit [Candidatus Sulfotelmatobacter sp.]